MSVLWVLLAAIWLVGGLVVALAFGGVASASGVTPGSARREPGRESRDTDPAPRSRDVAR